MTQLKLIMVAIALIMLSACGGSDDDLSNTHNPKHLVVKIKINTGAVVVTLYNSHEKNINDPSIDIHLNGESMAYNYSEPDNKAYYSAEIGFGEDAVFGLAMDNREYLLARITVPQKMDDSRIRFNRLPNKGLEVSWDHLGKYNHISLYKVIQLNPFPILDEEPRIVQGEDKLQYRVKIGAGEQLLPSNWLDIKEGRLNEIVVGVSANYQEPISELFHKGSVIEVNYSYERHIAAKDVLY